MVTATMDKPRASRPSAGAPALLPLLLSVLVLTAGSGTAGAATLERDWCTPGSPPSWGFSVTPSESVQQIRLRVLSERVRLLSAKGGPGMPAGWSVHVEAEEEVVATGPSALVAGERLSTFLIVRTNRTTSVIGRRGVLPVEWELVSANADGVLTDEAPFRAQFKPVMELSDAVSRGIVLATIESRGASGPVEITVDNPSWEPLWLDLAPGTILKSGGQDWVVGLTRPFRMMRKQKTGRTIDAFPLDPEACLTDQILGHRLQWSGRSHADAETITAVALAARQLDESSTSGARTRGNFEDQQPFEFWPLLFKWSVWNRTGEAEPQLLVELVKRLLDERAMAGDEAAGKIDPVLAAQEIETARLELDRLSELAPSNSLPMTLEAARARFK